MALPSRGDFGIILYKTGLPLGIAYTDITDTAQSVTELTGAYTGHTVTAVGGRSTSEPFVGAKDALSLFVTIALAGATDIRIKVQGRYKTAEPWCDLQSVREDDGTIAAEHTFPANGTICVQTASHYTTGQMRVVAYATGAIAGGTSVKIQARITQ